ncbi:MAG: tRNA threonylcarbamoyladenosine dehydratase [Bacilli bacterium]|nr:tRNA threonylcarbamoyladenosine dehydratase [Bacilli bacterium]
MFRRVTAFLGEENLRKIKNKTVLVVGLGGVGGYAVEALIRSGIHKIILIDYDKIDISNLNRQIITTSSNIGKYKVDVCKERILSINPKCEVMIERIFLDKNNINLLDKYQIDYIIDACDSVEAKKMLIDYALDKNIKLISSMGTANKIDPTKLEILDIRKTSYDPLAKVIRKYVLDKHINTKVMVVSSTERPIRKDMLASLMFVPSSAGILCAKYVIEDIINN